VVQYAFRQKALAFSYSALVKGGVSFPMKAQLDTAIQRAVLVCSLLLFVGGIFFEFDTDLVRRALVLIVDTNNAASATCCPH
jgi:hypothetical protein